MSKKIKLKSDPRERGKVVWETMGEGREEEGVYMEWCEFDKRMWPADG